ncbi:glycosyltransferase [Rhodoferax sp. OV413]|uniref:MraY family glycosyltransferase n=1 Tax=Rhodoferax sp. OV413 TaxID=1855285 RepID=UPI0025FC40F0|nr:glycosyltransferase [Rhodoferax sp. OV413]
MNLNQVRDEAAVSIWHLVDSPALWVSFASFAVAWLTVLTQRYHGRFSIDGDTGIQKFHTNPTSRVGGLAIGSGAACAYLITPSGDFQYLLWPLLVAGIPAFLFGLIEDLTKEVSVTVRLVATMVSGFTAWMITGNSISSVHVWGLDYLLGFTAFSVLFTAFAVGGIANAVNIIDGFNGLASGTVIIIFIGLALINLQLADVELARICVLFAAITFGFFVVNWPWGKLFLGDGGAYFLGFAVAWTSVLMMARHPEISAWALLVTCAYPILEVGFSVWRRKKRHLNVGDPDRLHLHSLVKRRFIRQLMPNATSGVRNSMTGSTMWLAALLPVFLATRFWNNTPALMACCVGLVVLYSLIYGRLTQFRWCIIPARNRPISGVAR